MDKKEIEKLAELAKIELSDKQKEELPGEIGEILKYVSEIKNAVGESAAHVAGDHRNVFREDTHPHAPGIYTEAILEEAPRTKNGYIKVKKVL